jgi:fibronectin type 3 domain-containing protein
MIRSRRNNYLRILLLIAFLSTATYLLSTYSFTTLAQEPSIELPEEIVDTEPPTIPIHIFPPKPEFQPVTVVNSNNFYAEWEPSEDNITLPENIKYQYIAYYYRSTPIFPEPSEYTGETRHPREDYDNRLPEGIFWYTIIAIDEAGNTSEPLTSPAMTQFIIDNSPPNKVEDVNMYNGYTSDTESLLGCNTYAGNSEIRIHWEKSNDNWDPQEPPPGVPPIPATIYVPIVDHYLITLKPTETELNPEAPLEEGELQDPWEKTSENLYYDIQEEDLIPNQNTYDFVVTAVDRGGNKGETSESCTLTIDSETPTTSITSPTNSHISKAPLNISGYSTDNYTLDTVSIYYTTYDTETEICNEEWLQLTTKEILDKETEPFNWSHYEYSLEDGTYCLKAQSKDLAENTEDLELAPLVANIMYDTTRPVIGAINISENRILESISTSDNLSGIKNTEMRIGALTQWTTYVPGEALDPLVNNEPGTYTLYIRATDNAGNEEVKSTNFTIPEPPAPQEPDEPVLGANTSTTTNNTETETKTNTEENTEEPPPIQKPEEENTNEVPEENEILEMDNDPMLMEQTDMNTNNYPLDYTSGDVKGESTEDKDNSMLWISLVIIIPLLIIFIALLTRKDEEKEQTF